MFKDMNATSFNQTFRVENAGNETQPLAQWCLGFTDTSTFFKEMSGSSVNGLSPIVTVNVMMNNIGDCKSTLEGKIDQVVFCNL